ncbi:TPA: TolC family protein, partial [Acinetobacter baumannii]|nr:TolC family protein [Acinetobacter baumannii]
MLVAGLWSFTSSSFALDLVETYERAKLNDPTWQANQQQFEADQLNLGLATGALLPTVTLSGNITRNRQTVKRSNFPGVDQEGLSDALVSNTSTTKQATLSARQPLFRMDAWEGYKQV